MLSLLKSLQEHGVITQGYYYFAQLIADKQKDKGYTEPVQNLAILLAALCNWSYTQGNTCCVLDRFLERNLFGLAYRHTETDFLSLINEKIGSLPVSKWQSALAGHIAFTQDPENQIAPLAFQFGAIYFYRAWQDEFRVAQYIKNALKNDRTLSKCGHLLWWVYNVILFDESFTNFACAFFCSFILLLVSRRKVESSALRML